MEGGRRVSWGVPIVGRAKTDFFTFVAYEKPSPFSDSARRETPKTGQLVSGL